jgi:glycosyltransferase involved in cell wall biosynthesis
VSIAHFRPSKDYNTLFEAIQIIKNKGLDIQLMVLGHTFNSDWPFSIINELNISDNVEIIGFVSNTQEYLLKADALVLSSFREGTPNAILEGMAHKLPIISSNIPGCDSLVKNAHCGFLFEKQNPEQLAEKIIEMMQLSREERKTMGESGYKYVYENYREEVVYEKWMALIEKAINQAA